MDSKLILISKLFLILQIFGPLLVDGQYSNCGGVQKLRGRGSFTSHPEYDGRTEYFKSNCKWILSAKDPNGRVALTFKKFILEGGDGCNFDAVEVFDGVSESLGDPSARFLGRFCGHKTPPKLVSSGSQLTVVFVADNSVSKPGFLATFETLPGENEKSHTAPTTSLPPVTVPVTTAPKSETCGPNAHKEKAMTVQIFVSPAAIQAWRQNFPQEASRGEETAGAALMMKMNRLFSENALGYGDSVSYSLAENGVEILDQQIISSVLKGKRDTTLTAQRFCKAVNKRKGTKKWDAAVIVIDSSERPEKLTSGAAAAHEGICRTNYNCVLLIASNSAPTIGILDRLLAHEFGHLFGVQHACSRGEYQAECMQSIMDSPGTSNAFWHARSRLSFQTIFENKRTNRCLRYRCGGQYERDPNYLLEDPGNKKVLDDLCFSIWGSDPEFPFKVDEERTGRSAEAMKKRKGSFGDVYRTNPEWFKLENVCKGVPCVMKKGKKMSFFGLDAKSLEGESCAVGKKCRSKICQ